MSGWTEEQSAALHREAERKQQMNDDGVDYADPAEREAWEETHPDSAPPKPDPYGWVVVTDRKNSFLGGPAMLRLSGSPDAPHLYASTPDSFGGVGLVPERWELVRFAREVLAYLGEDYGVTLPPWRPRKHGDPEIGGRRPWFLARFSDQDGAGIPLEDRYRYGSNGRLIRYGSSEAAQRAADKLNGPPEFTSPASRVTGTVLSGERLADGERRLTMSYPVSIGGKREEERSVCVVLTEAARRELREWLGEE
jgi:hypothetical protein